MLAHTLTQDEFERFSALIYRASGIRIPASKRIMLSNRVRRRLRANGLDDFSAYYDLLTSARASAEMPLFLDEITTNETYFYRDVHHFDWLGESFFPGVLDQARRFRRPKRLRIWSAACSTGEELYSIALRLKLQGPAFAGWSLTLLGTDLSNAVLDARAGRYDERSMRLVPADQRAKFFVEGEGPNGRGRTWAVKPELRNLTTWRCHNLLDPPPDPPFDCIFIKNALIYFDEQSKAVAARRLVDGLAKGGYLVVGPTEGIHRQLDPLVRHKPWLFQRPE